MKILAFLQNMWVRDPQRTLAMIANSSTPLKLRRRMQHYALFAGCLTGRRLKSYLGELTDSIIWEEASLEITTSANAKVTADLNHMRSCIVMEDPEIIVTFGTIAKEAIKSMEPPVRTIIYSPHPAARNQLDQARFKEAMQKLVKFATL